MTAPKIPSMPALLAMSDRATMGVVDQQAEYLDPGHIRRVTADRGVLGPADQQPYVTRSEHEGIPAGTACLVSRPDDGYLLRLEFEGGRVVWTPGYAAGIEWRLEQGRPLNVAEQLARDETSAGGPP